MEGIVNACPGALSGTSSNLFLNLINTLMVAQCGLSQDGLYPENIGPLLKDGDTFDFIVVGAGSAGSVVANRLAENKKWKVLLIEAGGIPSTNTEIPALYQSLQNTEEDWQYVTQPQYKACLGMKGRRCRWPRGKVLGGCSSINAMIYVRGYSQEYDQWAAAGNEGWDYESVLPYFKKSENLQVPELKNSPVHGKHGFLTVSKHLFDDPIKQHLIDANRELGYGFYDDEVAMGFFDSLSTTENGTRCSCGKAFLTKIHYKNLHLAMHAQVTKILFDASLEKAIGVRVKIGEIYVNLYASKEVVLSAGAINTPQILMTSGIGPKEHLGDVGVEVIRDLPVGQNLQDHMFFSGFLVKLDESMVNKRHLVDDIYEYFMKKKGIYATIGATNFMGFISTKNDPHFPNIQFHHVLYYRNETANAERYLINNGYVDRIKRSKLAYVKSSSAMEIVPTLAHPKSRGKILLASGDPLKKPLIFPNYLSDVGNEDLETLLGGVKYAMKLVESDTLAQFKLEVLQLDIPNCNHIIFKTDDYWRCAIRNMATTMYHHCGTCKMGLKEDSTTVVDSTLKVHGIKGLRVIDASVMPNTVSRNTNAATIMIAEKGADLIKRDWIHIAVNY